MRLFLAILLAAVPAAAQWDRIEMHFEGIGCASCITSIPERLHRIRGVAKVEIDAEHGLVTVNLMADNRVRMEQVREFIEQDGTKVVEATVNGRGMMAHENEGTMFRLPGQVVPYKVELPKGREAPQPGATVTITARANWLKPPDSGVLLEVTEMAPVEPVK